MAVEPYTEDQLRQIIRDLETKYASCIAATGFGDRSVANVQNIKERLDYFQGKLAALLGRSKQTLVVGSKGFGPARCF